MGVPLTPIAVRETIDLESLRGRRLAVDGNGELYRFLALIRQRDGTPLHDHAGRITSHLSGLFYRTTRLIAAHGLRLVYVFDGAPPALKSAELSRRRAVRQRYDEELAAARAAGDLARAYSMGTMTSRLTRQMVDEAVALLGLMGIPVVQAPSEGEAQAAHMARAGAVWAAASKDYDSLLFGTPRLVRFLTLSARRGRSRGSACGPRFGGPFPRRPDPRGARGVRPRPLPVVLFGPACRRPNRRPRSSLPSGAWGPPSGWSPAAATRPPSSGPT